MIAISGIVITVHPSTVTITPIITTKRTTSRVLNSLPPKRDLTFPLSLVWTKSTASVIKESAKGSEMSNIILLHLFCWICFGI